MATWNDQTRSTTSYTNQTKTLSGQVIATAGLYYGFGAFTYSGGQILTSGSTQLWADQTRSTNSFSNQIKN